MSELKVGDRVRIVAGSGVTHNLAHGCFGRVVQVLTEGFVRVSGMRITDGRPGKQLLRRNEIEPVNDLRWVCHTCDWTHPKDTSRIGKFAPDYPTQAYSAYVTNTFSSTSSFTTTWPSTPKKDNDMRITTVRTKAGYVGQVINSITEQIVHETKPYKHQDKAIRAAQKASDAALERAFK